jgi:uncharacterized membrane protein
MPERTRPDPIGPLADAPQLDRLVDPLLAVAERLLADRPRDAVLTGEWLGHPVHPVLTDLPIGFWTSSFVLDFTGGRNRRASDVLVGLGLLSALPTMASGLADWRRRERRDQRIGVVHAVANTGAWLLYLLSLGHRVRGNRLRGVAFGLAGATAATVGGYLGGHLAFGETPAPADDAGDAGDPQQQVVDQQGATLRAMTAVGR